MSLLHETKIYMLSVMDLVSHICGVDVAAFDEAVGVIYENLETMVARVDNPEKKLPELVAYASSIVRNKCLAAAATTFVLMGIYTGYLGVRASAPIPVLLVPAVPVAMPQQTHEKSQPSTHI